MMHFHRRLAGRVSADDGVLAIVDRQHAVMSTADEDEMSGADLAGDCGYGTLPAGVEDVGVWSTTGLGFGRYPVYVDVIDTPQTGPRVARIVIDCLGTEADPASADLRGELFDIGDLIGE